MRKLNFAGTILMGTVPLGWLFGPATGAVVAWRANTYPRRAGLVAGLLIAGGVVAGPCLGVAGTMIAGHVWLLFHSHG